MDRLFYKKHHSCLAMLLCVLLSACSEITLVGQYDEVIDQGVTRLHRETTAFLLDMEYKAGTPEGEFIANTGFYIGALSDIASLKLRASNTPQNNLTSQQLQLLEDSIRELMVLHEAQEDLGLIEAITRPLQTAMDVQFGAILKLEIAKKQGIE